MAKELIKRGGNYHKHVVEAGQWEKAIQGYLASIAFADAIVGRLLTLDHPIHIQNPEEESDRFFVGIHQRGNYQLPDMETAFY